MSDNKYLVAARKYRPQLFNDVVAQHHVTETLKNAIQMDRLAHAYLFSGPRGVGKTTVARILAKAINCEVPLEERTSVEPCEQCSSCTSFNEGRSLNVIEIDAASNNKVEDVRELRDTVRIPPQGARKKVYIVDEVHMLTNAAFNAFLKTLEEPPPYALFIFATTEPQKVIPTILSRCQRFDFKRIPVQEIVPRLRSIAENENIEIDEESLMLIAQKGDGALRDALSVFDQAVSLCGTSITYSSLVQALRVVDQELFFNTSTCIKNSDSAGTLDLVNNILSEGYDLKEFLTGLAGHFRNLLVAATTSSPELIEETGEVQKKYLKHSELFSESELLRILMILSQTEESLARTVQPRLAVELGLLKASATMQSFDLREAVGRLDALEKKVASTVAQSSAGSSRPVAAKKETQKADEPPVEKPVEAVVPKPIRKSEPKPENISVLSEPPAEARPAKEALPQPALQKKPAIDPSESTEIPTAPLPSGPGLFGPPALQKKTELRNSKKETPVEGSLAISVSPAARVPDSIESLWLKYVSTIKSLRIHVGSLLQHGAPIDVVGQAVLVAIPDDFHRRLLDNQHDFLLKHLNAASEKAYKKIEFVVREVAGNEADTSKKEEFDPYEYMKRKRQESPIVKSIFEDFGGELVW